jgi:hypothetical protein
MTRGFGLVGASALALDSGLFALGASNCKAWRWANRSTSQASAMRFDKTTTVPRLTDIAHRASVKANVIEVKNTPVAATLRKKLRSGEGVLA